MPRALPLHLRNRLAQLILDAFDDHQARRRISALAAFCGAAGRELTDEERAGLETLGWFEAPVDRQPRLRGAHRPYQALLCRRAAAAATLFDRCPAPPAPGTLSGTLARAALLADAELYFEVHELLEPAWIQADGTRRVGLQGLIQVAVAFHHLQQLNQRGAESLLAEGLSRLDAAGQALGVDTVTWRAALGEALAALSAGGPIPPLVPWPRPDRLSDLEEAPGRPDRSQQSP